MCLKRFSKLLSWATRRQIKCPNRLCGFHHDEVGELAVKTPTLMQGYFKDPEQTAASFRDGWFLTGDLVRRDADDFLFFFTRKKDIIRRRGENISKKSCSPWCPVPAPPSRQSRCTSTPSCTCRPSSVPVTSSWLTACRTQAP